MKYGFDVLLVEGASDYRDAQSGFGFSEGAPRVIDEQNKLFGPSAIVTFRDVRGNRRCRIDELIAQFTGKAAPLCGIQRHDGITERNCDLPDN